MTTSEQAREDFEGTSVWSLVGEVGVWSPDSNESAGFRYIERVRDSYAEMWDEIRGHEYPQDLIHEIADSAVPVYTADVWRTFVDLGAHLVDIDDLVGYDAESDMTRMAMVALYVIAEQIGGIALDAIEDIDEDDEDEE